MNKVACVLTRRGIIKTFAEILIELGLHEYEQVADETAKKIIDANFIHLCVKTSTARLLA